MFCTNCGTQIPPHAAFCPACGHHQRAIRSTPQTPGALKWIVPINVSIFSVLSCYSGLLSLAFFILILPSFAAIIFGVLALGELKRKPHLSGVARAWTGIVSGSVSLLFGAFVLYSLFSS